MPTIWYSGRSYVICNKIHKETAKSQTTWNKRRLIMFPRALLLSRRRSKLHITIQVLKSPCTKHKVDARPLLRSISRSIRHKTGRSRFLLLDPQDSFIAFHRWEDCWSSDLLRGNIFRDFTLFLVHEAENSPIALKNRNSSWSIFKVIIKAVLCFVVLQ